MCFSTFPAGAIDSIAFSASRILELGKSCVVAAQGEVAAAGSRIREVEEKERITGEEIRKAERVRRQREHIMAVVLLLLDWDVVLETFLRWYGGREVMVCSQYQDHSTA